MSSFLRQNGVGMYYIRDIVSQCIVTYFMLHILCCFTYLNIIHSSLLRTIIVEFLNMVFQQCLPLNMVVICNTMLQVSKFFAKNIKRNFPAYEMPDGRLHFSTNLNFSRQNFCESLI
jgi:hypothetical protein